MNKPKSTLRKQIVAGNWKMNKNFQEADELIARLKDRIDDLNLGENEVVICPPSLYLELATDLALGGNMMIGAQNVSQHSYGAYTGEICAEMLNSMEVNYCIVGHSERRKFFKENPDEIKGKVARLLKNNIIPIFCCGENETERENGEQENVVRDQIEKSLFHLNEKEFQKLVIAYEPVWAIGTGKTATPEQAQEMHGCIRKMIAEKYGDELANGFSILYGGSCNSSNASTLFSQPDVDGGLIGGASLKEDEFVKIIESLPALN